MISQKWVNTADDGAVPALLQRMAMELPADTLDALWIFPTRRAGSLESTVIVAACRDLDPDRRRVYTARFVVTRDRRGRAKVDEQLQEHATAPADALERVVEGVVRRLGDEAAHPPRRVDLAGDPERFDDLIRELGGTVETGDEEEADGAGEDSADTPEGDAEPTAEDPAPDPA